MAKHQTKQNRALVRTVLAVLAIMIITVIAYNLVETLRVRRADEKAQACYDQNQQYIKNQIAQGKAVDLSFPDYQGCLVQ